MQASDTESHKRCLWQRQSLDAVQSNGQPGAFQIGIEKPLKTTWLIVLKRNVAPCFKKDSRIPERIPGEKEEPEGPRKARGQFGRAEPAAGAFRALGILGKLLFN